MSHWHQKTLNWIDTLPEEILSQLRQAASHSTYAAQDMVFGPEPDPDYVYMLENGRVRIYSHSSQGGEYTYSYVEPGFVFGELSVLENNARRNFAQAVETSGVIRIPKEVFLYSMHHSVEFSTTISIQLAKRLTAAKVNIEDLVFKDARSRIARKLTEIASLPELRITHADMAKMTGVSRPTASIVLGELEESGLISKYDGSYTIRKTNELAEIANTDIR